MIVRPDNLEPEERAKDRAEDAAKDKVATVVQRLEPEIALLTGVDLDAALKISTAISLKRIADALELPDFSDKIERAISTGMYEGAQNAIGEWRRNR